MNYTALQKYKLFLALCFCFLLPYILSTPLSTGRKKIKTKRPYGFFMLPLSACIKEVTQDNFGNAPKISTTSWLDTRALPWVNFLVHAGLSVLLALRLLTLTFPSTYGIIIHK